MDTSGTKCQFLFQVAHLSMPEAWCIKVLNKGKFRRWDDPLIQYNPNLMVTIVYGLRFALDTARWKLKVMEVYTLGLWYVSYSCCVFIPCFSAFLQPISSLSSKIPPGSMVYYLLLTHVPRQIAPSFLVIFASPGRRMKTSMIKLLCGSLADKMEKFCNRLRECRGGKACLYACYRFS